MADMIDIREASRILGLTPPSVRALAQRGLVAGEKVPWGKRSRWVFSKSSVDAYARSHPIRGTGMAQRVAALEQSVARLEGATQPAHGSVEEERDRLRVRVVLLEDALARIRAASELQRRAATERETVTEHLLAALKAGEEADRLQRQAVSELEEAVAGPTRPGNLSGLA